MTLVFSAEHTLRASGGPANGLTRDHTFVHIATGYQTTALALAPTRRLAGEAARAAAARLQVYASGAARATGG